MSEVPETEVAYGGIVFDGENRVLLRKPSNGWGNYAWTFPKGAPEPELDATPEQTALREVQEETGVTCEVVSSVPGRYESDTCFTQYFLMRPLSQVAEYDFETEEVRWVTVEEAVELIALTTTPKGRKRDLDALSAAIQVLP